MTDKEHTYALLGGVTITRKNVRNTHVYEIEGDERVKGLVLPSVTTVLNMVAKPALVAWAERQAISATLRASRDLVGSDGDTEDRARMILKSEGEERMNAGNIMHEALLSYADGMTKLEDMTEDFRPTAEVFEVWLSDRGATVTHVECAVYDPDELVGGTLDIAGTMGDGTSFIGDLKSSSNVYPEHVAQVAGYEAAAAACLPGFVSPARCFVFLAGPDGRFEPHELTATEVTNGQRLLRSALDMYEAHAGLRKAIRERERGEA
jgi:hypothetical protein